jgi:UDP-GlcNAc:undecaprenyl-phosphate GlcNAc-1-phosphate transferase
MIAVLPLGLIACVLAVASTLAVRRLATATGVVAQPSPSRWHGKPVPLFGGVAIAAAIYMVAIARPGWSWPVWALLGGALVMLVVGVLDDFRPLKPQTKLIAQILVASAMATLGLQLRLTGFASLDVLVTLAWFVAITNALNLLDNMDGLAAGVAAITVAFRLAFFLADGNAEGATLAAIVLGALLGFLVFNFNPASIFMGDAGSLFLGVIVSGLSLVGGWPYSRGVVSVLLFPVLILLVPIFDTLLVTVTRTFAGRSIAEGGRDHTSHRLVALGLSEREAVLLLYTVSILSGTVALLSYRYQLSYGIVLVALLVIGLTLFGVYVGRIHVYPEDAVKLHEGTRFVSLVSNFMYKRQVAMVVMDLALIVLAYYLAYILRFEDEVLAQRDVFIKALPVVIGCQLFAFAALRVYQGVWRYTGLSDLFTLAKAVTVGSAATVTALVVLYRLEGFSKTVFVVNWFLLVVFASATRLSFRTLAEVLRPRGDDMLPVLVYGAGDGGVMVLREIRNNLALRRRVVGFLDDNARKHRTIVQGVPVFGGVDRLQDVVDALGVEQVIVSSAKIPAERVAHLQAVCEDLGVSVSRAALRID